MANASRGVSNRRKVFNKFTESLRAQRPDLRDKYMCPICLDVFDRSAVEGAAPDLTLEHVIPDELGQRLFVLTCSTCNNDVGGAKLDATLHRKAAAHAFLSGERPIRAEVLIDGLRLAVDWNFTPGSESARPHNDLRVIGRATSPAAIEQSQATLKAGKDGPEMTIRFPVSNPRYEKTALLKVGYLIGFLRHGYQFALSPTLDLVREQIRDPSAELLPVKALVVGPATFLAARRNSLALIEKPTELQGFMALVELKGMGHFGVLLPHPESPPGFFDRAEQHRQSHGKIELALRAQPPE